MDITLNVDINATKDELASFLETIQNDESDRIKVKFREWKAEQYLAQAQVEVPKDKFVDPLETNGN